MRDSLFGFPANTTFVDVWSKAADFITDYKASGIYANVANRLSDSDATLLYYLLYARYGNSSINTTDRNRFKYACFTIMFTDGPAWVKRLDIQSKVRALTDNEIISGSKAIYNHAFNPGTAPSTATLDELTAINEQNTTNFKKSKLEAYAQLYDLIDTDVTTDFLNKFKRLFNVVVMPQHSLYYEEPEV